MSVRARASASELVEEGGRAEPKERGLYLVRFMERPEVERRPGELVGQLALPFGGVTVRSVRRAWIRRLLPSISSFRSDAQLRKQQKQEREGWPHARHRL